jgi:cellulose synthase/poly-beta-1,6-N-acetylglucosamine synthase-like glycosyltransferase
MGAILGAPSLIAAWPLLELAARWGRGACVGLYVAAQALLVLYSLHRCLMLWRRWRARPGPAPPALHEWPRVTVQLPVYNERRVVERLIDSVARLDYPPDRLEIQVLDDSSDETRTWAERAAARHAARGVNIRVLHRGHRAGFKAGALAEGMRSARGEFLAVFDSDFVPERDFLRRALPHFADPRVGMVQARWGHLNRDASLLTAAEAVLLDSHFAIEHEARMRCGLFFNFNGSAGVWRRASIEAAGGWSHDTLTEDLDLSYRAQLEGWRFVYDDTIEAPAELPGDLEALKSQQRRWVRGSIQTARKILPRLLSGPLPASVKLEALVHLTNNMAYPLLLSLLLLPLLAVTGHGPPAIAGWMQGILVVVGMLPVCASLAVGQLARGRRAGLARGVLAAVLLGIGLAFNNARAAIAGLGGPAGEWERTPKSGSGGNDSTGRPYPTARRLAGRAELVFALYFAAMAALAVSSRRWIAVPMPLVLCAAFGAVGAGSLRASLRAIRAGRSSPTAGRAERSAYPRSLGRASRSRPTGRCGARWRSPRSRSARASLA